MNIKDTMALRKYIQSHKFSSEGFNFYDVFKEFSTYTIHSVEDMLTAPEAFENFLNVNYDCFNFENNEEAQKFETETPLFLRRLHPLTRAKIHYKHKPYSKACVEIAPFKEQTKILEVGSGFIPYSSMVMAKEFDNLTSMDKFMFSPESLKHFNINAVEGYFNKDTSVEDYDFIVGRRPCSAIESIVQNASKANKPYFLQLCCCDLENIAKREGIYREWEDILPEYDPNIKFIDNYAFNIDATVGQVSNILEQSKNQIVKNMVEEDFLPGNTNLEQNT